LYLSKARKLRNNFLQLIGPGEAALQKDDIQHQIYSNFSQESLEKIKASLFVPSNHAGMELLGIEHMEESFNKARRLFIDNILVKNNDEWSLRTWGSIWDLNKPDEATYDAFWVRRGDPALKAQTDRELLEFNKVYVLTDPEFRADALKRIAEKALLETKAVSDRIRQRIISIAQKQLLEGSLSFVRSFNAISVDKKTPDSNWTKFLDFFKRNSKKKLFKSSKNLQKIEEELKNRAHYHAEEHGEEVVSQSKKPLFEYMKK
jgi:hypothetical protein